MKEKTLLSSSVFNNFFIPCFMVFLVEGFNIFGYVFNWYFNFEVTLNEIAFITSMSVTSLLVYRKLLIIVY
jgi:hypothetical protein